MTSWRQTALVVATETRELYRTGHGHYSVEFLPCVGRVVESYVRVLGIEVTDEIQQWRVQLELERRERLQVSQEDLDDEKRLVEAMGDETQKMKLLTLLKHGLAHYERSRMSVVTF
ncbi:hypothetical protein GN244_ATG03658 [Phytophthora infestans]|uniref:Uncharacterized protein n=1 Tax=Phytophthora infestans TaxID=4787 RepID=A0A833WJL0_PHYIN|nr:hypothetical protein GN244_ATG03658 [Phytophthora infestans]